MKTDLEDEIWKDVPGFEGLYQVSNMGRVKSLAKKWICGMGTTVHQHNGKILKQRINEKGYYCISLSKNKVNKGYFVSRLVWETFNGKTDLHIDHIIEGNKADNRLCNLQPLTHRENIIKNRLTLKKTSKYVGVSYRKNVNNWQAYITIDKKRISLGVFKNEIDAATSRQIALEKYYNGLDICDIRLPKKEAKGIYFNKTINKFEAYIHFNKKKIHLGKYRNIEDAKAAVNKWKLSHLL
jgi:hypothetical protein